MITSSLSIDGPPPAAKILDLKRRKGGVGYIGAMMITVTCMTTNCRATFAQETSLLAAVLPSSRSVPVGQTATAFATIINTGTVAATGCSISPSTSALSATLPITFTYQTTNPTTNGITGPPNSPATIAPGASQTFVFGVTPTGVFGPTEVTLNFQCANAESAPVLVGLNTFLLSGTTGPDVVALSATYTGNGIVNMPAPTGTGAFSVATINLGAAGAIRAMAGTGGVPLPVTITLCQTNPASGACVAPPAVSVTTAMATSETQTFAVFVSGSGLVPLDPGYNRVVVQFYDAHGNVVGSTSVAVQNSTYQGPLIISQGGTYSGNWESLDANQPAALINTSAPVVIQNCFIRGKSDLIETAVSNANVTVQNCLGFGLDPGISGRTRGAAFNGHQTASLTFQNNYVTGTAFGVHNYGMFSTSAISIQYNMFYDLDGVPSDGNGGRILTGLQFGQDNGNHAIMLDSMQTTDAVVAWNQIVEDPYVASLGDIISIYRSQGIDASHPIEVHDNYLYGGYSARIDEVETCCGPNATTFEPIAVDGAAEDTAATTTAYTQIFNNQIVSSGGIQGIGINAGHDNQAWANRIISTGQLTNGIWISAVDSNPLTIANWTYNQPPTVFFNNSAYGNSTSWEIELVNATNNGRIAPPQRSYPNLTGCATGLCVNNTDLADPTSAMEAGELTTWQQKLTTNGIVVGPVQ